MWPPGSPKVDPPDCPFDILSASSSGSASRLLIVSGLTGCVVNAQVPCAPDRKATSPATAISILFIEAPSQRDGCWPPRGLTIPAEFAWVVSVVALTSCVSQDEVRREGEATFTVLRLPPRHRRFTTCLQRESLARRYVFRPPHLGAGATGTI